MQRREPNKKRLILALVILIVLVLGILMIWKKLNDESVPDWDNDLSQEDIGQITYEGKKYSYNTNLTNILFMGVDSEDVTRNDNMPGDAGQSDCLMVLTLDKESKIARILQIPRDTMTDVDLYDVNGEYRSTVQEQIATQYAYSIGGKNSCWATKKTVSELLYELPIDGYLAMDYSSIEKVNDAIGGVEITIPKDYTTIDPSFVQGTTLKLSGKQAHDYVRYRDTSLDFSNNERMERQRQFVPALIDTMRGKMETESDYFDILFPLVEKYMITDLEEDEIKQLLKYEFDVEDITVLPGEGKKGEIYEEFYLDEKKTQKILIEMFYILEE